MRRARAAQAERRAAGPTNPHPRDRRTSRDRDVLAPLAWRIGPVLTRLRIHAALALVAAGALALVPPAASASDPVATIAIRTFQFAPDTVRVSAGSRVAWTDEDETEHTVTGGTPQHRDERLRGVLARKGSRYEATRAR
jgi:plastocyanin